jgi:hypothetical protein
MAPASANANEGTRMSTIYGDGFIAERYLSRDLRLDSHCFMPPGVNA